RRPGGAPDADRADGGAPGRAGAGLRDGGLAPAAGILVRPEPGAGGHAGEAPRSGPLDPAGHALHALVGAARRARPPAVVLRDRPVPGPALPRGRSTRREPAGASG